MSADGGINVKVGADPTCAEYRLYEQEEVIPFLLKLHEAVEIFRDLFDAGFPIERMQLVADYGADDLESMLANNTSGFNCRFVEGTQRWSEHAFGQAIDLNPLINPWVRGSVVSPAAGAEFADRSIENTGGLYAGSAAVAAFEDAGWIWGGSWESSKDYQHFSTSGS